MNTVDKQYQGFLRKLIMYGQEKEDRTGTGTLSYFGETFRHDMSKGFPLLTTKKMAVRQIFTELKWFLKGRTDIKYLQDNNCHIWDGDYKKSGNDDGSLGRVYGAQWRGWIAEYGGYTKSIDQISELITNIKETPNSRRLMVSAWNVAELDQMVLPPCHYGFQCYVNDGKLSLMWNQRSVDTFLGLPFNIASYALLTMMIAKVTKLDLGEFVHTFGDAHLYSNHLSQAKEQLARSPKSLPKMKIISNPKTIFDFEYEDFVLEDYDPHPHISAPVAV